MSTSSSPPELKWNRFDALVALAVVLLAVVSALCFYLPKNQSGALTVVIDISGQEVRRVPLSDFTEATVTSRGYTLHRGRRRLRDRQRLSHPGLRPHRGHLPRRAVHRVPACPGGRPPGGCVRAGRT